MLRLATSSARPWSCIARATRAAATGSTTRESTDAEDRSPVQRRGSPTATSPASTSLWLRRLQPPGQTRSATFGYTRCWMGRTSTSWIRGTAASQRLRSARWPSRCRAWKSCCPPRPGKLWRARRYVLLWTRSGATPARGSSPAPSACGVGHAQTLPPPPPLLAPPPPPPLSTARPPPALPAPPPPLPPPRPLAPPRMRPLAVLLAPPRPVRLPSPQKLGSASRGQS